MSVFIGIKVSCNGTIYETPKTALANNSKVANLVLAVNNGNGDTEYIDLAFWGKDADLIMRYPVGHHIMVDCGKLSASAYIDKEGNPRTRLKINVAVWHSLEALSNNSEQKTQEAKPESPSTEQQKLTELKNALNFTLKSGKYAGKKVADILLMDAPYIYNLCIDKRVNAQQKRLFCISYQYWYEKTTKSQQQTSSAGTISGVKNNVINHVPENVPDGDLPF